MLTNQLIKLVFAINYSINFIYFLHKDNLFSKIRYLYFIFIFHTYTLPFYCTAKSLVNRHTEMFQLKSQRLKKGKIFCIIILKNLLDKKKKFLNDSG